MSAPGKSKLVSIGNYALLGSILGKGTFGRVELGCHKVLKTKVALKILFKAATKDP
jgi:serine/threonine protein kinase